MLRSVPFGKYCRSIGGSSGCGQAAAAKALIYGVEPGGKSVDGHIERQRAMNPTVAEADSYMGRVMLPSHAV